MKNIDYEANRVKKMEELKNIIIENIENCDQMKSLEMEYSSFMGIKLTPQLTFSGANAYKIDKQIYKVLKKYEELENDS